jgi:hypothetical protein
VSKWITLTLVAALALASGALEAQKKEAPLSGGNGTLYIGTYAGNVLILDEATEKVVGEIKLKTGIPRSLALSEDRSKFLVLDAMLQKMEVIDIATRATLDTFTLSEGHTRTRIRSFAADPLNRFLILLTRAATKQIDRWEIGPSTLLQYDLAAKKVMRTIPWPDGEEREFVNIRFSPDGKLMYFFSEDVLIYETTNFTQVDKWELSRPIETGAGRIDFSAVDDFNDEKGYFTGIFTMQDPVQKRRLMGVGRVNLAARDVDFFTIGPQERVSFTLAPDRKKGYGLVQQIGRYEFWTFDLEKRKLQSRMEFRGRPRMELKVSTNGKLLYVYEAGNTIDLYEAATYKYLRTITLNADTTTDMYVMPARPRTTN